MVVLAALEPHRIVQNVRMSHPLFIINTMGWINVAQYVQQLDTGEMTALIYVGHATSHV